jgi:hypothetical protein
MATMMPKSAAASVARLWRVLVADPETVRQATPNNPRHRGCRWNGQKQASNAKITPKSHHH